MPVTQKTSGVILQATFLQVSSGDQVEGLTLSRTPMNLELAAKSVATILTSVEISFILTLCI